MLRFFSNVSKNETILSNLEALIFDFFPILNSLILLVINIIEFSFWVVMVGSQ
jgi:hypothetical protein